jgi:hypothetical protein
MSGYTANSSPKLKPWAAPPFRMIANGPFFDVRVYAGLKYSVEGDVAVNMYLCRFNPSQWGL